MKKILAIMKSYTDSLKLRRMIQWEALGFSVVMEYIPLSAIDKIHLIRPEIIIIQEGIIHVATANLIDEAIKTNSSVRIIIISSENKNQTSYQKPDNNILFCDFTHARLEQILNSFSSQAKQEQGANTTDCCFPFPLKPSLNESFIAICATLDCEIENNAQFVISSDILFHKSHNEIYILLNSKNEETHLAFHPSLEIATSFVSQFIVSLCNNHQTKIFMDNPCFGPQVLKSWERVTSLKKYSFFYFNTQLIHTRLITEGTVSFNYDKASSIISDLLIETVKADLVRLSRKLEELYFSLLLKSKDFKALSFCKFQLEDLKQFLSSLLLDNKKKSSEKKFKTINEDYYSQLADFDTMAQQFSKRKIRLKVIEAIKIISIRYVEPISLFEIADSLDITPTYLSRLFKEDLFVHFVDYINSVRVLHSKQLMLEGQCNMKGIAKAVGFIDPKYFTRVFKKTTNMTPSQYIQKIKEDNETEN